MIIIYLILLDRLELVWPLFESVVTLSIAATRGSKRMHFWSSGMQLHVSIRETLDKVESVFPGEQLYLIDS